MRSVVTGAVLALSLVAGTVQAADAAADLTRQLAGISSLSGRFEQTILDASGQSLQEASGEMTLARGNRFRWLTISPFEQLAVSDGETVWIYDRDLEQVVVKPIELDSANTPALLFAGDPDKVTRAFAVTEVDSGKDLVTWRLVPHADDALFTELDITFRDGQPRHMRLEDALGQQTGIAFHDVVLNAEPDPALFRFQPPEGTDVIQQGP